MSIPPNPTSRVSLEGRGSTRAEGSEAKRGNRAQLIVGGAVGLVLIGTTAFVLLRESGSSPPEAPPAVQPAPAPQPAPPTAIPPPAPAPSVAVAPPVAPTPAPAAPQAATPETPPAPSAQPSASTIQEPQPAEPTPPAKGHKPVRAEPQAGPGTVFTLQLGSFLIPTNASALVARLNAHGGSAYEKAAPDASGKTWHFVRFGAFDTKSEAEAAAEDLKRTEGISAVLVRTKADEAK